MFNWPGIGLFTPVVDDEEATVVYRQIIADNNA
jgi:hypothetical protein